jgi:membrane protease YdiL (CAAX protease family)
MDPTQNQPGRSSIAPLWHTGLVLAMLACLSVLSSYLQIGSAACRLNHLEIYLIVIGFDWCIFAVVLWGSNGAFVAYVARAAHDSRSLLVDIPVAALVAIILVQIGPLLFRLLGPSGWVSLGGMLPTNRMEIALWIVMAISAGISEETVFRGYLQQQFSGWTAHVSIGILGQAVVFGLAHGYQGWKNMTALLAWGCILGASATLRKGLRSNMMAHAAVDIFGAF